MSDTKRCKRVPVQIKLRISDLFKQNNVQIKNIDAPITVVNMSMTGIGFVTEAVLPIGYYFNAKVVLGENKSVYYVVKIVRSEERENEIYYGCEFVGRAEVLNFILEEYDTGLGDME